MTSVLLLNASYEPLSVIPQRRAVSLMIRDRVDRASEESFVIKGIANEFYVPVVLRLRRYINVPRRGMRWTRQNVLRRDEYCCAYCGIQAGVRHHGKVIAAKDFTVDHIIPRSRGGKSTWGNTVCACPQCNQRKGNHTPHEIGMSLRWEPKIPRVDYLVASGNMPAAWKVYLRLIH